MIPPFQPQPFALFADCTVHYAGRATSLLERGLFLVLYKQDGSVSVHGGDLVQPRNYMGAGSRLLTLPDGLQFTRRGEKVVITLFAIRQLLYLPGWSCARLRLRRTEQELAQKLFQRWEEFLPDSAVEWLYLEYPTVWGPIDVLGRSLTTDFVMEVKRKKCSLQHATQLRRYVEALTTPARQTQGFLVAPAIGANALRYLRQHGLQFLELDFDP